MYWIIFILFIFVLIVGLYLLIHYKHFRTYHSISIILFVLQYMTVSGYSSNNILTNIQEYNTITNIIGQIFECLGFFLPSIIGLIIIYFTIIKNKLIIKYLKNKKND